MPDRDRRRWARSRMVMDDPDDLGDEECEPMDESSDLVVPPAHGEEPAALRVSIVQYPVLDTFFSRAPSAADPGHQCNFQHGPRLLRQAVWFRHNPSLANGSSGLWSYPNGCHW